MIIINTCGRKCTCTCRCRLTEVSTWYTVLVNLCQVRHTQRHPSYLLPDRLGDVQAERTPCPYGNTKQHSCKSRSLTITMFIPFTTISQTLDSNRHKHIFNQFSWKKFPSVYFSCTNISITYRLPLVAYQSIPHSHFFMCHKIWENGICYFLICVSHFGDLIANKGHEISEFCIFGNVIVKTWENKSSQK